MSKTSARREREKTTKKAGLPPTAHAAIEAGAAWCHDHPVQAAGILGLIAGLVLGGSFASPPVAYVMGPPKKRPGE